MSKKETKKQDPVQETPQDQAAPQQEETVQPQGEQTAPPEEDPLLRELEALKDQNAQQEDKYLRLAAEYDNYRRRSTREREAIYADVRCDTLKKFLPVYDSLSRALAQTPADDPARKGLEGIMNQYNTALNQLGVTAIEAVGQPFDANRHNAVMHIEDDAYGEGVVVEEFEKGFCIGDRVLRYSVVKVAN